MLTPTFTTEAASGKSRTIFFRDQSLLDCYRAAASGMYVEGRYGSLKRFQCVKLPARDELAQLSHATARRVGRFLKRQGLIEPEAGWK